MVYSGIFATEAELDAKVGENVDLTGWTEANKNAWIAQAESYINCMTRNNFTDTYNDLDNSVKRILSEAASNLVAVYGISFNMVGYTSREEAEDMMNILWDRFNSILEVLRDDRTAKFMNSFADPNFGPLTTKGDIFTFDTANNRLPVGTNGQVLVADSTQSLGIKWGAAGGAPITSVFGRTGVVVAATNDYTWAQIDKTTSNIADITTKSHTSLTDIGTNAHSVIDTHLANTSNPHSVTSTQVGKDTAQWNADEIQGVTVDDTDIGNGKFLQYNSTSGNLEYETLAGGGDMLASTYDPASISEQLVGLTATQTLTNKTLTTPTIGSFTNSTHDHADAAGGGTIAHTDLTAIGTNAHSAIDTHIADSTLHYTQANITVVGTIATGVWNGTAIGDTYISSAATWNAKMDDLIDDTTPQLGGDLDMNQKSLSFDPTPTADHTWSGKIISATAGEGVVIGDVCYLKSDGKFWKVDADAEATSKGLLVMATGTISADASGVFLLDGFIRDDTWTWTVGAELFCSLTPGNPTATKPSATGDIVRLVGYAYSADIIYFNPDHTYIEIA